MDYTYSEWTQIKVTVKLPMLDKLIAIMSAVDVNLMIEDFSDIDLKSVYGDLIDEAILNADKTVASVSVFLPENTDPAETLGFIKGRLAEESLEADVAVVGVNESDWANTWKQYYKPLHIGNRIVIVPKWEEYEPEEHELVVRMDPGMAFGTGSHETTKLVIGMLENRVSDGCTLLDVGCGSGILAICGKKLGAGVCRAYDIDPIAVEVAAENAAENGCEVECGTSDLLRGVKAGEYDIICANIVADIIIRMAPDIGAFMKDGGVLIVSGIIIERAGEVLDVLEQAGFTKLAVSEKEGWAAALLQAK